LEKEGHFTREEYIHTFIDPFKAYIVISEVLAVFVITGKKKTRKTTKPRQLRKQERISPGAGPDLSLNYLS
jgi:hypothetical protein